MRRQIDSRKLDQRITFQSGTQSRSTSGSITTAYSTVVSAWASIEPMRATERIAAGEKHQVNAYTCWIQADLVSRFSLTSKMRVMWRNEPYDILEIKDATKRDGFTEITLQGGLSATGA